MESQRLMRPGGRNAEPDSSSPRVYFLTDTKFYELVFMWSDPEADHAAEREMSEWQAMLLSPLRELPMGGFDLTLMVDKVHDGSSNLLHISSQLREYEDIRCVPSRVGAINLGLPRPVLFVVPSFTTPQIHDRIEAEGDGWHYLEYMQYYKGGAPQPPQPSEEPLTDAAGEPLFDALPVSRRWEERIAPKTRLLWPQVLELIQQAEQAEGCIALRYYAEPRPPDGRVFDSLEWLNAASLLSSIETRRMHQLPASGGPSSEE